VIQAMLVSPILLVAASFAAGCTAREPEILPDRADAVEIAPVEEPDLSRFFGEIEGTIVILDQQTGRVLRHNARRAGTRFLPASTFKIPNTLIALETGVATGPDFTVRRDSTLAPKEDWWPSTWAMDSHTLRTALPNSVVWYYQELARRIGPDRMTAYLDQFDYGNGAIGGGIDRFWLTGELRISAEEQVEFLRRFYLGQLEVDPRSSEIVRELLLLEETPTYRLSGKTGWANLGGSSPESIGWLVGYVERGDDVHFFAMNIDIRENRDAAARLTITKAILQALGLIEQS
jgi:beta-lactamase class D